MTYKWVAAFVTVDEDDHLVDFELYVSEETDESKAANDVLRIAGHPFGLRQAWWIVMDGHFISRGWNVFSFLNAKQDLLVRTER